MRALRVVKVGGSLLDWPLLPQALTQWLDSQPPMTNVLIAGGGPLADAIRQVDVTFDLGDQRSHGLCLEVMGVTARLLADLLAERARLVSDLESIISEQSLNASVVLDVREFMQGQEPQLRGECLPHTWDVTSDSIAARLAIATEASELVLLKSCESPADHSLAELAEGGFVDRFFPKALGDFRGPTRFVNLRATTPVPLAAR